MLTLERAVGLLRSHSRGHLANCKALCDGGNGTQMLRNNEDCNCGHLAARLAVLQYEKEKHADEADNEKAG